MLASRSGKLMITVPGLAAEALGSFLAAHMKRRFGSTNASLIELIALSAKSSRLVL